MKRGSDLFAYVTVGITILAFAVLLVFALIRLLDTEAEIRRSQGDNMLWSISQAQSAALLLDVAVSQKSSIPDSEVDIARRYDVLLSRLALLTEGPQARYMEELGMGESLARQDSAIRALETELHTLSLGDATVALSIHELLETLSRDLGRAANRSMVKHWDATGARLDRQQAAIIQVIVSILGIIALGIFLSVMMLRTMAERQRIRMSLSRERESAELYRSFVGLVSHQFRTPLAVIDSSMQRILRSGDAMDQAEIQRRALQVRSEVGDLTRLIEATLEVIRLDTGQVAMKPRNCDIAALLERVKARQLTETPDRAIDIVIGDEVPPSFVSDPFLAEQVLTNLVSNAVKYSPETETVLIGVRAENRQICFSVQDQGIGIPAEEQDKLFGHFFRASTAQEVPGTGVGLSISAQLAELLGGRLDFVSTAGIGSTFTLRLPDEWPAARV
ncbi:HAMP domain-containing histidine kinase [Nitratireductor aquimarinus]|uniref:sensor histidine kinase n=1 Tax=Nitratireductor TaxID=245876 RepID=UPI0019D34F19|nr:MULTISPECIES: HAMP domain-containing sensor histidine kinase [Nitratireductor]MBN7776360.1 HAMP domain-containing histidine kinase [Nitratireductor pacificus]MBN7779227.1 HAMP domain-containing histidine kinase [Nitratireductor pacificus]MBN7788034.1 HAMP domain-containing histidine kinase [Nitratireductor aquimarinus]MBY6098081.1 HAMP domain-containing histidine kinase [Nitratireductor aquimarinus]MCA1259536.1 HAMP domain-containing histidine kinase [Nitratireductor aquimarinus]